MPAILEVPTKLRGVLRKFPETGGLLELRRRCTLPFFSTLIFWENETFPEKNHSSEKASTSSRGLFLVEEIPSRMRLINLEGLPKIPREIIPREFSRYLLLLLFAVEGDHTDFERRPLFSSSWIFLSLQVYC